MLYNGLDDSWYRSLAEEAGMEVFSWMGRHVIMKKADIPIKVVWTWKKGNDSVGSVTVDVDIICWSWQEKLK